MQQDAACERIARLLLEEDVAEQPVERLVRLAALAAQRGAADVRPARASTTYLPTYRSLLQSATDERRAATQRFEHARSILLERCRADNVSTINHRHIQRQLSTDAHTASASAGGTRAPRVLRARSR